MDGWMQGSWNLEKNNKRLFCYCPHLQDEIQFNCENYDSWLSLAAAGKTTEKLEE